MGSNSAQQMDPKQNGHMVLMSELPSETYDSPDSILVSGGSNQMKQFEQAGRFRLLGSKRLFFEAAQLRFWYEIGGLC